MNVVHEIVIYLKVIGTLDSFYVEAILNINRLLVPFVHGLVLKRQLFEVFVLALSDTHPF